MYRCNDGLYRYIGALFQFNEGSSSLAKEIARHTGWKEKVWSRRYPSIVIREKMRSRRLKYVLARGV